MKPRLLLCLTLLRLIQYKSVVHFEGKRQNNVENCCDDKIQKI